LAFSVNSVPSVVKALLIAKPERAFTTEGTEFTEKTGDMYPVPFFPFSPAEAPIDPALIPFGALDLTKATKLVVM
jgi:hypothetical protein